MAQDLVTVYNLALSAIGTEDSVSLPTEKSREAEICNRWYPTIRDSVLRAAHWPSAKAVARLATLAARDADVAWTSTMPPPPYLYAFALPSDHLYPRYLAGWGQFELGQFLGAPAIFANEATPILTYTFRQESIAAWDPDLFKAVVKALAAAIALPLHGKAGRAKLAMDDANQSLLEARVRNANNNTLQYDSLPDWYLARGYGPEQITQFIYPMPGPIFSGAIQ